MSDILAAILCATIIAWLPATLTITHHQNRRRYRHIVGPNFGD